MPARGENKKRIMTSTFRGAESDTQREVPPEFRAACDLRITDQPVPVDTAPDELDGNLIIASKVEVNEIGQAIKRTTKKKTGAIVLHDQELEETTGAVIPKTRTMQQQGTSLGQQLTRIHDLGNKQEISETIDTDAFDAAMAAFVPLSYGTRVRVDLPDVLNSVTIVWEYDHADGTFSETGTASSAGGNNSIALNGQGSADAEASVLGTVLISITKAWPYKSATDYYFYMKSPFTEADVLARLLAAGATVSAWPNWNPRMDTIVCRGQKRTLRAQVSMRYSSSATSGDTPSVSTAFSSGTGTSKGIGVSVRDVVIPHTIHGAITFSGSSTQSTVATATASGAFGGLVPSVTATVTANGTITPSSLAATVGTNTIPSGDFLETPEVSLFKFRWFAVRARVVHL